MMRPAYLSLGALVMMCGCAAVPGRSYVEPENRTPNQHRCYHDAKKIDLEPTKLLGIPKLNPLWWLNIQRAEAPASWKSESPAWWRELSWRLRNPAHNLANYVLGVKDRDFVRVGCHADEIWNPNDGWNFAVIHCGPLLHLPFISFRSRIIEIYAGWRAGGDLGFALRAGHAKGVEQAVEISK